LGPWPGTKKHVYQDGWIHRFYRQPSEPTPTGSRSRPLAEVGRYTFSPIGKIYLPDASYREMTEWALPVSRQIDYEHLVQERQHTDTGWKQISQFLKGVFGGISASSTPESNEMYARMLAGSASACRNFRVAMPPANAPISLSQARSELVSRPVQLPVLARGLRGLYLPHLRKRHLQTT